MRFSGQNFPAIMENEKPSFFQNFVGDYLTQRLSIPPAFMKHLSKDMSDTATTEARIKNPAGCWPVKLRKTSTYTYIEEGWPTLVEEFSLGYSEFLLFQYEGNMCFDLQIFEKTGCERVYATVVPKKNGADQRNAEPSNSQNPHFKIIMKQHNVERQYILRLPAEFSRRLLNSASGRLKLVLENSKGEAWEVNASMNNGTYCLCGGWLAFVQANKLKLGDECFFELLQSKDRIRVHF